MVFSTSRALIAFPQSSEAVRIADSAEDRSAADSRLGSFSLRVQEVLNAAATNRVNIKNMRRAAISEDSLLDRFTARVTIRFAQRTNHHNTFRSQGGWNHTLFTTAETRCHRLPPSLRLCEGGECDFSPTTAPAHSP